MEMLMDRQTDKKWTNEQMELEIGRPVDSRCE